MDTEKELEPLSGLGGAAKTLSEVEAAIDKLIPKENADHDGPMLTGHDPDRPGISSPRGPHAAKKRRLTVRASRKANRPKGPTRRQRRKRVAPR
jgi:hypothetical protein